MLYPLNSSAPAAAAAAAAVPAQFDPRVITDRSVCVIVGVRGTGKSTLINDLVRRPRHGIVFAHDADARPLAYQRALPPGSVHAAFCKDALSDFLEQHRRRRCRRLGIRAPRAVAVFDNCIYSTTVDRTVRAFQFVCMAMGIQFISSLSYPSTYPSAADYIFLLSAHTKRYVNNMHVMCNLPIGGAVDLGAALAAAKAADPYNCLVYDRKGDRLFWYKVRGGLAPPP